MINWTTLIVRNAATREILDGADRMDALRDFRARETMLLGTFDRTGGDWETDEPHTWGPQFADDVDWSGFPLDVAPAPDAEATWNAVFGPYETPATVIAEAATQNVTPQGYARSCLDDAVAQGFDCDRVDHRDAFAALCAQLGVEVS